ncbi:MULTISPECIES: DUF2306 domain-containing protein [unclassified Xanthomonas]|uniref:DUF2306 domain-containing protein n=1 Tax=unclassified Xanthomonas TaxID=2643310 RepID=UPI00136B08ED|nr:MULTISPECIES: DUF2306 domain-containing protein [unclassified Xanthomonas]MXV34891.1 DUF2306 domain-containing protein [Xanthomonas sp. LMG 8989]
MRLAWWLLWLALALFAAEFVHSVYLKYASLQSPAYAMFLARRGWLWCHLGGGAVGLLLGALQFATQRWRRWPRLHRWVGRAYFAGMMVAMIGAAGLIATSPAPPSIRGAFAATALAWLVTGSVGLVAIWRGQMLRHQRWMVRAYLATLAPVVIRVSLPSAIGLGLTPSPGLIALLLWASWVVPLSVYGVGQAIADARDRRKQVSMLLRGAGLGTG